MLWCAAYGFLGMLAVSPEFSEWCWYWFERPLYLVALAVVLAIVFLCGTMPVLRRPAPSAPLLTCRPCKGKPVPS